MIILLKMMTILEKNDGFYLLKVVKMMFSIEARDRRSNVTNVRMSGKASLA